MKPAAARYLIPLFMVICMVVPVSASGEVFINGDFTSSLDSEWSIGSTSGDATITIQRLTDDTLRFSADGSGGNWGNKKITQKVDLTTVTQLTVRYKATTAVGAYPRFRVYIDGSYEKEIVFYGADGNWYTTTVDVPVGSRKKDVNVDLYVQIPTGGGLIMYVDYISGTHSRSAHTINSVTPDVTSGQYPLDIEYSADITDGNPTTKNYYWVFYKQSGGSWVSTGQTSTSATPTFTASDPGTYMAAVQVDNIYYTTGPSYSSTTTVRGYVPSVDFAATTSTSIAPGGTVSFQSDMSGATSYLWEFGDGTSTSSTLNPTKQYDDAGTYTVKLTGTNEWGSRGKSRTDYINVGSHSIAFDKIEYVSYETAKITHTLFDPDFGSHTYEGRFYKLTDGGDLPASPLQTWSITGATAPKEISMSGLATGNYVAVLFVDGFQNTYAPAAINKKSGMYGNVILASASDTKLADAVVTLTGGSNTSIASGAYGIPLLTLDSTQSVSVTKTSYVHEDHEITLSGTPISYNYHMYMLPETYSSGVIRGIVRDENTYQPYAGATVTLGGTASDTTTTNQHGYFEFTGLGAGTYSIDAETTDGYSATQITGLSNKETVYPKISGLFTVTVEVLDTSANPIGSVAVSITQAGSVVGEGTTDATGKVAISGIPAGTATIMITKTNYVDTSETHVIAGSTTITMEMLRTSESPVYGSQYPPHQVKFEVRTYAGAAVSDAVITATGGEASFGTVDWLKKLFGLDIDETPIHSETMSATTDSYGVANFLMFPVIKYDINVIKDESELKQFTVYPKDDYYLVVVGDPLWRSPADDPLAIVSTSVSLNDSTGLISVRYLDLNDGTSAVTMNVYQRSSANKTEKVLVGSHTINSNSDFTYNFTMSDYARQSYYVEIDATHGQLGKVERLYSVTFGGVRVPIGDIPEEMYIWIALGILMLSGCIFGATSAVAGAVIVCFFGWILLAFGWLDDLGLGAPISLGAATVIAVIGVLQKRHREEGFN